MKIASALERLMVGREVLKSMREGSVVRGRGGRGDSWAASRPLARPMYGARESRARSSSSSSSSSSSTVCKVIHTAAAAVLHNSAITTTHQAASSFCSRGQDDEPTPPPLPLCLLHCPEPRAAIIMGD